MFIQTDPGKVQTEPAKTLIQTEESRKIVSSKVQTEAN